MRMTYEQERAARKKYHVSLFELAGDYLLQATLWQTVVQWFTLRWYRWRYKEEILELRKEFQSLVARECDERVR